MRASLDSSVPGSGASSATRFGRTGRRSFEVAGRSAGLSSSQGNGLPVTEEITTRLLDPEPEARRESAPRGASGVSALPAPCSVTAAPW